MIACSNKHKNYLGSHSKLLEDSIIQLICSVEEEILQGMVKGVSATEGNCKLLVAELLRLFNGNLKSCLPSVTKTCIVSWIKDCGNAQDLHKRSILISMLGSVSKSLNKSEDAADVLDACVEACFTDPEGNNVRSSTASWDVVNSALVFPKEEKIVKFLQHCVENGHCLLLSSYVSKKVSVSEGIKDEEILIVSLLDWLRHLNLSNDREPQLPVLYHQCLALCQRQLTCGASEKKVAKLVIDLVDVLAIFGRVEGSSWNILGMIGLSTSYKPTPRAKFLSTALAYFLMRQVLIGPTLRSGLNDQQDEFHMCEGISKCLQALNQMKKDQAYLGLLESLDWVLEKSQDASNTFSDVISFLQHLISNNLYTERYVNLALPVPN